MGTEMNRTVVSLIVSLLAATAANAADVNFSSAYVQQVTDTRFSNLPSISTADIVKPVFTVASGLSAMRPSSGNLGLVWQQGDNNSASLVQSGLGNVGLIQQIGLNNTASIEQYGSNHAALVFQQGNGNIAVIRQR